MKKFCCWSAVLFFSVGLLSAVAVRPAAPAAEATRYFFEGQYSFSDWGRYIDLPFQVPEDTTIIKVRYSYSAHDGKPAVLDIGLYDPEKFRGWSGGARSEFAVSESLELTTEGYLAGAIPAGEWRVELGIPIVEPSASFIYGLVGLDSPKRSSIVSYQVEVELFDDPVGEPFVMPPKHEVVLSTEPGWYYGDLHCHSTHSDGEYPLEVVLEFARRQGLDFIAPTEHNTISHFARIPELQALYDDMLILYGLELTSYIGHANIFDYFGFVDYRATDPDYDINAVIDEVHAGGGYYSPNHPAAFLSIGIPYLIEDTDWSKVNFYEVVNGRTRLLNSTPNPINLKALQIWDRMLREGHRITAIGGSDDHQAGRPDNPISSPIGIPTTVVYAEELSSRGIMEGLAAGRAYILNEGRGEMRIEFTASGGGQPVMMGDLIEAGEIEFRIKVEGARFKALFIIENGFPLFLPILSDNFEHTFKRRPRSSGYIRLEVMSGHFHEIITNPIYYARP